jgi:23S rRNA (adenine2503-C2)-methyltransferase
MQRILVSNIDKSQNIVIPHSEGGFYEARYVQRNDDYFIVYLSSHNGCNYSCRMCHLTQTGQTIMIPAEYNMYIHQAKEVLKLYKPDDKLKKIHFNFMARGEPLDNHIVLHSTQKLIKGLAELTEGLDIKFNISTIMPQDFLEFNSSLISIFEDPRTQMYYSLYSMNPKFRKKWLPKAMDPNRALDLIKEMQLHNGKEIVIHGCFIKDHNDSPSDVLDMIVALESRDIDYRFNIVRFNTHDETKYQETEKLYAILGIINYCNPDKPNKIVDRVGFDVNASCGMFV